MPSWYLDEGLVTLRAEWKRERPSAVVYTIGDTNHSTNPDVTQHAPDDGGSQPGDDKGEVDAADFMRGHGVSAADLETLFQGLHNSRDPRILYVIYNGRIFSSVVKPWEIRAYSGRDKHTGHLHLSVNDKFNDNTSDWQWEKIVARELKFTNIETRLPTVLQYGDDDDMWEGYNRIARLQAILNWMDNTMADIDTDGVYGAKTASKIARVLKRGNGKQLTPADQKQILGLS